MLSRQWYSRWSVGGSYHVNSPGWSSFMKLQILLTPCLHEVGRLFLFKAFQPLFLTYLDTVVVATLISWSWSFLCVLNYYAMPCTYNFLKSISHLFKEGHSLFGLSSKVFTFYYSFTYRSDFFNSLAIFLTEWPEDRKNRCLSSSTNTEGVHFHEREEKINENSNNTKVENRQNGKEKYDTGKNLCTCIFGVKMKQYYKFFPILVWNCFERLLR